MQVKPPHIARLDRDFAGVTGGSHLPTSSPLKVEAGTPVRDVAQFWRVVAPSSPLARKLRAGSDWITHQHDMEQAAGAE